MREQDWQRQFPEMTGHGIDSWIGYSPFGNQWLVTMWFGDEDSGGEIAPNEFAIELDRFDQIAGRWVTVTHDTVTSRAEVLELFEQMKATCD